MGAGSCPPRGAGGGGQPQNQHHRDAGGARCRRGADHLPEVFRDFGAALHLGASHDSSAVRLGFAPFTAAGLAATKANPAKPVKVFRCLVGKVRGKTRMWSSLAYRFRIPVTPAPVDLSFSGKVFDTGHGRNVFDVGVLYVDRQGRRAPHLSWLPLRDNAGTATLAPPAPGSSDLLVVMCHRGPLMMLANEKTWPSVPFLLELTPAPAGATPSTGPARFETLHREP